VKKPPSAFVGGDRVLQVRARRAERQRRLRHVGDHPVAHRGEQPKVQRGLGGEVVEQAALGDTRRGGHGFQRHRAGAAAAEQIAKCDQYALARVGCHPYTVPAGR